MTRVVLRLVVGCGMPCKRIREYQLLARISIASAVLLMLAHPVGAQASQSCLRHPAKLSDTTLDDFRARPGALLQRHPDGGVVMSAAVRRLAGSNISVVPTLVSLAKQANIPQVVALGVGLGKAVAVCRRLRPDLALRIKEEVERAAIRALSTAFAASLPTDNAVAAMGGVEDTLTRSAVLFQPGFAKASEEEGPVAGGPLYVGPMDLGIPRSFFGNGGIGHTVTKPVSPAR